MFLILMASPWVTLYELTASYDDIDKSKAVGWVRCEWNEHRNPSNTFLISMVAPWVTLYELTASYDYIDKPKAVGTGLWLLKIANYLQNR